MLASLLLLALPAFAEDPPAPDTAGDSSGSDSSGTSGSGDSSTGTLSPDGTPADPAQVMKTRKFLMEVNFRGRYMFLPDSVLDIWYFDKIDNYDRPSVAAYSLGLEFVIKDKQANGIFYAEYINPLMQAGYWDDREQDETLYDGSWIEPDKFGLVAIGADYGYELKANNWFSFLFGGGLGVGIRTGNLVEWQAGEPEGTEDGDNVDADCGQLEPAFQRKNHCGDDGDIEMPHVIPMVDINIGFRFSFSDKASLRLEGGLHDLPYGGASVGIVF
jgi:hypothetical protein